MGDGSDSGGDGNNFAVPLFYLFFACPPFLKHVIVKFNHANKYNNVFSFFPCPFTCLIAK